MCIRDRVYSTPGNRLSDFSPLLDVPTVGGKMLPGKVLQPVSYTHLTGVEYITVPDDQMDSFIKIASHYEEDTVYYLSLIHI